jgi:hypothetical protein
MTMVDFLKRHKWYFILGSFLVFLLAVLAFVSYGYYPIAIVNGNFISAHTFLKDYSALAFLNANLSKISATSSDAFAATPDEISRSVMNGLVENALVEAQTKKETRSDFSALIDQKVAEAAKASGLENAAKTLYGLSFRDFKDEVLRPQAELDILRGRLFLKGQNIDEWLANAKKSARVVFLSGRFRWSGDHVELK